MNTEKQGDLPANSAQPETPTAEVSATARLGALLLYAGGAPFYFLRRRPSKHAFLAHHARNALAVTFLLYVVSAIFLAVVLALSYALVHERTLYEDFHAERMLLNITRKLFLCWLVVWGFAALLALLGSTRPVLLVGALARRARLLRYTGWAQIGIYALLLAVLPFAVHASVLTKGPDADAQAYMIYDDMDRFPHWLFDLGFYPIARAANARWGPGSAAALELSPAAIAEAKAHGRFIFIGSHGRAQGILCDGGWIQPADVAAMPANPALEYVYLTSCDSGAQRRAWEGAFAPAKVVTFDRLSAIVEHIWWLYFEGADTIRALRG